MINKTPTPKRRSIRLKGYDYAQKGLYFITLATFKKRCLFGRIQNGKMSLSEKGRIAEREWLKTFQLRSNIQMEPYIIMPNHMHGIVFITYKDSSQRYSSAETFGNPTSNSLSTIIRSYKSAVTRSINGLGTPPKGGVWQRNYYEHVIRDESSCLMFADYILNNPVKWREDRFFAVDSSDLY